ncbi:AMP-binding protein [Streptomyces sp. NPDC001795]|uniref:AMP-binding protein n=1 Tax=Streptomyces sp. NPDC001795 TaxID=3154525 RepID=UPI00331BBB22
MNELFRLSRRPAVQSAAYYEQGWWRRETFLDDLHSWARTAADQPAYVNVRRHGAETATVTFGELADWVERLAGVLWSCGVRPGDAVAFQLPNLWEAAALWLACGRVGTVAVSLPPWAARRERDLVLSATRPGLIVTTDDADVDGCETMDVITLRDLLCRARSAAKIPVAERPQVHADDVCQVLCSSGTTGRPKAVAHTFNTRYAGARAVAAQVSAGAVTATAGDLTHSLGLVRNLLSPLVTGRPSVFLSSYDPDDWLDVLERHRVNSFSSTPLVLGELVCAQRQRPRDLSSLQQVISTGAPIPARIAAGVRECLTSRLVNSFGMTESGLVLNSSPETDRAEDTLGRPVLGFEVRKMENAEPARLRVRGPGLCCVMFDLRTGTVVWDASRDEGWYDTGDLVRQDEHGCLRYVTRVDERIGSGNMIPVVEVEGELMEHPAVAEVAIVGVPDQEGHETACAVIVPRGTAPALENLRDFLSGRHMSEEFLPTCVAVAATLPRTPMGKIRKAEIRRQIADGTLVTFGHLRASR